MVKDMISLYEEMVFNCKACNDSHPFGVNVYMEKNQRCDKKTDMYKARQAFLQGYIHSKDEPVVMIVGQSPGFNGCGFTGIPFTAEVNAIEDLGLPNYHLTVGEKRTEPSADKVYEILREVAQQKSITVKELSKKIIMTNAFQCIPANETLKALCDKKPILKKMAGNCKEILKRQIDLVQPQCIICLGGDAWRSIAALYNIYKPDVTMTELVRNKQKFLVAPTLTVYPLFHPGPRAALHQAAALSEKLFVDILNQYIN